jgi:hypothetical protein
LAGANAGGKIPRADANLSPPPLQRECRLVSMPSESSRHSDKAAKKPDAPVTHSARVAPDVIGSAFTPSGITPMLAGAVMRGRASGLRSFQCVRAEAHREVEAHLAIPDRFLRDRLIQFHALRTSAGAGCLIFWTMCRNSLAKSFDEPDGLIWRSQRWDPRLSRYSLLGILRRQPI